MRQQERIYINGQWLIPEGAQACPVVEAATGAALGSVPLVPSRYADLAVQAARAAFDGWASTDPSERARLLGLVAQRLQERGGELAELIAREVGTPIALSQYAQAGLPAFHFANAARLAVHFPEVQRVGNSEIVREPVGVVACITPWNFPLHQVAAKVAPALAAGCTVVLKPSEVAPLSAFLLADILDELGFPPGVFNLVSGTGTEIGEALVAHPMVDMVSFTGSTQAGQRVGQLAARGIKRVALELGGKSPVVILDDADLELAIPGALGSSFMNNGQTCIAQTRMLVSRRRYAEVVERLVAACEAMAVGNPLDPGVALGPWSPMCSVSGCAATSARGFRKAPSCSQGAPSRQVTCLMASL